MASPSIEIQATSKAPLLINSCEVDPPFPPESQAKTDEMMGGGKFAPGYERTYWEGCTHGFAVKGDIVRIRVKSVFYSIQRRYQNDPKTKEGKEGSFKATVEFYKKYL